MKIYMEMTINSGFLMMFVYIFFLKIDACEDSSFLPKVSTSGIYNKFKYRKETDIKSLKPWLMRKE